MKKVLDLRFVWAVGLLGLIQPAFAQSDGNARQAGNETLYLQLQLTRRI